MTGQLEPNRLSMIEFLTQLDTAENWMLWSNPAFEEVELIVKDADGKMTAFHGPEPMTIPFDEYKKFCAEVEKISEKEAAVMVGDKNPRLVQMTQDEISEYFSRDIQFDWPEAYEPPYPLTAGEARLLYSNYTGAVPRPVDNIDIEELTPVKGVRKEMWSQPPTEEGK